MALAHQLSLMRLLVIDLNTVDNAGVAFGGVVNANGDTDLDAGADFILREGLAGLGHIGD